MPAIVYDVLDAIGIEPCQNDRDGYWCRVITLWRYRGKCVSELSWPLALRLVPKLLASHGIEDIAGWVHGRGFIPRGVMARTWVL